MERHAKPFKDRFLDTSLLTSSFSKLMYYLWLWIMNHIWDNKENGVSSSSSNTNSSSPQHHTEDKNDDSIPVVDRGYALLQLKDYIIDFYRIFKYTVDFERNVHIHHAFLTKNAFLISSSYHRGVIQNIFIKDDIFSRPHITTQWTLVGYQYLSLMIACTILCDVLYERLGARILTIIGSLLIFVGFIDQNIYYVPVDMAFEFIIKCCSKSRFVVPYNGIVWSTGLSEPRLQRQSQFYQWQNLQDGLLMVPKVASSIKYLCSWLGVAARRRKNRNDCIRPPVSLSLYFRLLMVSMEQVEVS
ncbi:hypothetical protein BDA99DRAFT_579345 [Phascolomyces articulosus]|uniref:Uncharacterized protein n=1 Tax=Phascolomyces articulosus TaxID=60185 RepID=A0AAD5KD20_9FUNG|nr:hypothetical protein BDA99DRAFT_579345 [Phascolomyces articulosus]